MAKATYKLKSKVIAYPGEGGWRFLGVPLKTGRQIKEKFGKHVKGWGSLPVSVTLGKTSWGTSIFPDRKSGTYLLPLKALVRKKEDILDGDSVEFTLRLK